MRVYLVGALRNPCIPTVGRELRAAGFDVFDDWFSAGPDADDHLWAYERRRGHTCRAALAGEAARHIFDFDMQHLDAADAVVLVAPAGRSGHLELGWAVGKGKLTFVLQEEQPERIEVMLQMVTGIAHTVTELIDMLRPVPF